SDANRTMLVRADASAKSAAEIGAIEINPTTRVGDVADVVFGPAERTTALRMNGGNGVGINIIRQAKSNALEISSGVRAAVDQLNLSLPDGVKLIVTSDDATFIRGSIESVVIDLLLATAIVISIIYIFLRSVRITFIPAITVPIALIGAVGAIWAAGFSINILTLLALVLAIGMVVDDAIVVIENIMRQRGLGLGTRAAAVLGTKQVFFAVLSTTATLAAVFIPISFFPGVAGRLFSEFGFVLAFAVTLSAFVALTLCPMLASRWIGDGDHEAPSRNPVGRAVSAFGRAAERLYARLLSAALAAPMVVVVASVLFAGAAAVVFTQLPSELTPPEDRGFVPMSVSSPQGATVDYTSDQIRKIEAIVQPLVDAGEVQNVFANAQGGGGGGFVFLTLTPWDKRTRSQMEITAELNRKLQSIPGIQVFTRTANSLGIRGGGQGLQFAITGTDYGPISEAADVLMAALQKDPRFDNVRLNFDTTQPQISIKIDRERASDVGIPVTTISTALQTLLAGTDLGNYYQGDDQIKILAQAPYGLIQDAGGLDRIQLRTAGGKMVPLSSLVSFEEVAVAPSLQRQDQRRAVPMTATLTPGIDLRKGMTALEATAATVLPAGMNIVYSGEAKELNTTTSGVFQTFAFALLVVLLVLAGQFESFNSAFILIATVPFGLAAAIFAMLLTGGSLNIYSQIGLIMLVGLMSKNGILIVEFANQLRDQGQSVNDAIRNAALIRLRPVVMTMFATVLGGLPLLLTGGAGAEARRSLGWIIVGGLGFATIATLFLTPVVFSLLARFAKPRIAEEQRLDRELAAAGDAPRGYEPTTEESGDEPPMRMAAE
ncbi:MAG: efflux RND transporter permease subunit, partial [Bauldia sp.]